MLLAENLLLLVTDDASVIRPLSISARDVSAS
jgi:hypothetical protein